jgi:hypothetical protein
MERQPWISRIRNARTTDEQIVTLKALKNELIGHPLKKQAAVASGVLDPIIRMTMNRTGTKSDGKAHDHTFASKPLTEDELVRLYGLQVIASITLGKNDLIIAHGGY